MRVNLSRGRSALISAFLVVAFSIGLSLTVNQTVLARTTSSGSGCSSRYGNWQGDQNCNSSERNQSYNRCLTTSNTYWGSMWLGNGGYYNDTLIIESNATEVDASIRGSMLRCTMDSAPNGYNPWAIEVRKARVGDRMRDNTSATPVDVQRYKAGTDRVNIKGSMFSRGTLRPGSYWTDQGTELPMTIDVRGLSENGRTDTINIFLYRCNGNSVGTWDGTNCVADAYSLTVIRKPQEWSISGKTWIKGGSTTAWTTDDITVGVGDTIQFSHGLGRNGRTVSSNVNYYVRYSNSHAWNNKPPADGAWISQEISSGMKTIAQINDEARTSPGLNGAAPFVRYNWGDGSDTDLDTPIPGRGRTSVSTYTTTAADAGKIVCQWISYSPSSASNPGSSYSNYPCARVRSGFELYPEVKINGANGTTIHAISIGDTLTSPNQIKESIYNRGTLGDVDRSDVNPVEVSEFIVKGGADGTGRQKFINKISGTGGYFGQEGAGFRFALASWESSSSDRRRDACNSWLKDVAQADGVPIVCRERPYYDATPGSYRISETLLGDNSAMDTTDNVDFGDLVCRIVSVGSYSYNLGDPNQHRISIPACVMIAKTPKVQFWGADVRTGANVITGRTTRASGVYGSWAEFAIMANGTVSSASGASLSSGPAGRPAPIGATQLTFSNISSPYGHFGATFVTPTPEAHFPTDPTKQITPGAIDIATLDDGTYTTTGDITLANPSGQSLSDKRIALRAQGNVTIADNITYGNGPYATAAELPQLVVIAESGNIVIAEGVTRLDAWLIAKNGYVSTCGVPSGVNWTSDLSALVCDKQLTINGPILARNLYLRRTYGDAANPGTPAEILNLRPDVYLYGFSKTRNTGSIRTMYVKELAPRL